MVAPLMSATYASPDDLVNRLGRDLGESETTIVSERLDDAEELIRTRIPDLDDQVSSGALRPRLLVMVETEAVMRILRNPDGYSGETDGNYSYTIDAQVASGRLSILPEEWRLLGVRSGIAMVSPRIRGGWLDRRPMWYDAWAPKPRTAVWG